jgi:hypothetical protein
MTGIGFWDFAMGAPLVGGGMAFGFVVVKWFTTFIFGRIDKKEDRLDAGTQLLIVQLQEQVKGLLEHKESVEKKLADCLERDIEKERRIAWLEGLNAGMGDARQSAARIVAADKADRKAEE